MDCVKDIALVSANSVAVPWLIVVFETFSNFAAQMLVDKVVVAFVWASRGDSCAVYTDFDCFPRC